MHTPLSHHAARSRLTPSMRRCRHSCVACPCAASSRAAAAKKSLKNKMRRRRRRRGRCAAISARGRRDATDGGRDGEDGSAPVLLAVRGGDVDTRGRDADTRTGCLCGTCFAACDIWGYPMRGTSTCGYSIWLSGATPFGATQLGANQNGAALRAVPYTPCPTRRALCRIVPARRCLLQPGGQAASGLSRSYSSPAGWSRRDHVGLCGSG